MRTYTPHARLELQLRMCMWPPAGPELALPFAAARRGFPPRLPRGMWDQAGAVRRVLLPMRAYIRHNC